MFDRVNIITKAGRISYFDNQGKNCPTLLFIHGNSACVEAFEPQLSDSNLSKNFRLIAIDLPGHGESAPAENPEHTYSFRGYAEVIAEIIEKLDLENVIVVGWSLGGHIAIELINKENAFCKVSKLKGLVLTGTPPVSLKTMQETFAGFNFNAEIGSLFGKEKFTPDEATRFMQGGGIIITEKNKVIIKHACNMDPKARPMLVKSLEQGINTDQRETVTSSPIPIEFVIGANDSGINNTYLYQTIAECNKKRQSTGEKMHTTKTLNTGHATFHEAPAQFNKDLIAFAEQHCNTPRSTLSARR